MKSFTVYTIQFFRSVPTFDAGVPTFDAGRTSCGYMTPPLHIALCLLTQQGTTLPHAPHSPGLASCKFFFFSHIKEKLCGCQFQSAKEVITVTIEAVLDFSAVILEQCLQQLYQHWETCMAIDGN
jgi:hypothetical protein